MKQLLHTFLILFLYSLGYSQIIDDFSDGEFNQNPQWLGNTQVFQIENQTLVLNNTEPESNNASYLYTLAPTDITKLTTWEFSVQLDFAPSASNFAKVYLAASNPDLSGALDGYFIKIGGISGSDDAIELFRQDGSEETLLLSGTTGGVGSNPAIASVRVTRTTEGIWELFTDYSGGQNFVSEGQVTDSTIPSGAVFGFVCVYTSTRSDLFQFDNVLVDPIVVDETPPVLLSVTATTSNTLEILFDEPVDQASLSTNSFLVDNNIGTPTEVVVSQDNPALVILTFTQTLENFVSYTITISNIRDNAGNNADSQMANFSYVEIAQPSFEDLIITEIFADPTPSVGLPDFEYIEIFNRSNKVFNLEDIAFSSGSSPKKISSFTLLPNDYVIICDEDAKDDFSVYGNVATIDGFPALTNGGDDLSITDENGNIIFEVSYQLSWYKDNEKSSGGWSLELVELEGPYNCNGNWYASQSSIGGSPGMANSVEGSLDQSGPLLTQATVTAPAEIMVLFNEAIDPSSVLASNFEVTTLSVIEATISSPDFNAVTLTLGANLQPGTIYSISATSDIKDCLGNPLDPATTIQTGLAEIPEPNDFVINEILFNPESGGEDFIELLNLSSKIINLKGLEIVNTQKTTGNTSQVIGADFLLLPGSFAVITDVPEDIKNRYTTGPDNLFLANDLPTLEDKMGNVTISMGTTVIDAFDYEEDFHFSLLDEEEGVSLERLNPFANTQDPGNWHSAASVVGYATPGLPNSQLIENNSILDEIIFIPEKTISPDEDGFQDLLVIQYETDQPGYILNSRIFDMQGREVKYLIKNELLNNEGTYNWDGITESGTKARLGIYILWFELFDENGSVSTKKIPFVVAGRLD